MRVYNDEVYEELLILNKLWRDLDTAQIKAPLTGARWPALDALDALGLELTKDEFISADYIGEKMRTLCNAIAEVAETEMLDVDLSDSCSSLAARVIEKVARRRQFLSENPEFENNPPWSYRRQ